MVMTPDRLPTSNGQGVVLRERDPAIRRACRRFPADATGIVARPGG